MEIETMKKTVSDAVEYFDGVWPFADGDTIIHHIEDGERYVRFSPKNWHIDDHWYQVCTRNEFEQAAREMGYPKNNEAEKMKPMPSTLKSLIDGQHSEWAQYMMPLDSAKHTLEDMGYTYDSGAWLPPVDQPKVWRGMEDGLPPDGTVCEATVDVDYIECEVIAYHEDMVWLSVGNERHPVRLVDKLNFRPIRSDREKWVEAAEKTMESRSPELDRLQLAKLYDALASGQLPTPKLDP